jgi:hypothetical protein
VEESSLCALLHVGLNVDLPHVLLERVARLLGAQNVQVRLEPPPLEYLGAQGKARAQGLFSPWVTASLAVGVDGNEPPGEPGLGCFLILAFALAVFVLLTIIIVVALGVSEKWHASLSPSFCICTNTKNAAVVY